MSAFDEYRREAWPYEFRVTLHVPTISGGIPASEKVAEGWIRTSLAPTDDRLRAMVAEVMVERSVTQEEAVSAIAAEEHINGFKRDAEGYLFIEGRQVKAAIKEAASVAVASGKIEQRGWGATRKSILGFLSEHVVVVEDRISLGTKTPTGTHQRFIHKMTPKGPISAIHYEEYVENAVVEFTVRTDYDFAERDWAMIWVTGEQQGIGASRSQGFGRYTVMKWEPVHAPVKANGKPSKAQVKRALAA